MIGIRNEESEEWEKGRNGKLRKRGESKERKWYKGRKKERKRGKDGETIMGRPYVKRRKEDKGTGRK